MSNSFSLFVVVVLSLMTVLGDFFIKLAGDGPKYLDSKYFILGFLVYVATIFGWFWAMKHLKLSTIGVYYSVIVVTFLTLIAIFYFKETLNIYEIVGVMLAIVSLLLLGRFA